ncbi:hypothetical protein MLD63_17685 [Paracoccus sp. TK19116]|uniref:Collagen-like protein n=1 Tax=Paracoccus albicereus TaxID=2922394 RepID=A0ABT1MVL4_9RHOB|nr:hypothetical protein [Paracoccus albicereus]MCQ0972251.1 hypothetical protein [Paracoccus albicereus]
MTAQKPTHNETKAQPDASSDVFGAASMGDGGSQRVRGRAETLGLTAIGMGLAGQTSTEAAQMDLVDLESELESTRPGSTNSREAQSGSDESERIVSAAGEAGGALAEFAAMPDRERPIEGAQIETSQSETGSDGEASVAFAPPLGDDDYIGVGDAAIPAAQGVTLPQGRADQASSVTGATPTRSGANSESDVIAEWDAQVSDADRSAEADGIAPPDDSAGSVIDTVLDTITGGVGVIGGVNPVLGSDGLLGGVVGSVQDSVLDPLLGADGILNGILRPVVGESGLIGTITAPVLGPDGLLTAVTDSLITPILGPDGIVSEFVAPILGGDGPVGGVVAVVQETVLDPLLGNNALVGGVLDPVLSKDGVIGSVTGPMLGQDGLLGGVTETLIDPVLGNGGVVEDVVAPLLGSEGALASVVGTVEDGVLDPLVDGGGLLGGLFEPVLAGGDLIGGTTTAILGQDGAHGDTTRSLIDTVTGDAGLVGKVIGSPLSSAVDVDGAIGTIGQTGLDPLLGNDGLLNGLASPLPGDSLLGGLTAGPLGGPGLVRAQDSTSSAAASDSALLTSGSDDSSSESLSPVGEEAANSTYDADTVADDDGFLDTLLGLDSAAAWDSASESLSSSQSVDELLGSLDDSLVDEADGGLKGVDDGVDDLLAGLGLSGLLAPMAAASASGTTSTTSQVEADPEVDALLGEIIDSGDRALGGLSDPLAALLDEVGAEGTNDGFLAEDLAVETALAELLQPANSDDATDTAIGDFSLLGALQPTQSDEQD